MNTSIVIDLGRDLLVLALLVSLPMLATAIAVGLFIAIIQTVTAVHEQTLASVPKMISVLAVAVLVMPWALGKIVQYTRHMIQELPRYAAMK